MLVLTTAERRGALVVVLLLSLGAANDLWHLARPLDVTDPARPESTAERAPGANVTSAPPPAEVPVGGIAQPVLAAGKTLDLNRATVSDLDALPGIGPVLARRIVDHRERHGPFLRTEDLLAIRGIGPGLHGRLAPHLVVGGQKATGVASARSTSGRGDVHSAPRPANRRADSASVVETHSR